MRRYQIDSRRPLQDGESWTAQVALEAVSAAHALHMHNKSGGSYYENRSPDDYVELRAWPAETGASVPPYPKRSATHGEAPITLTLTRDEAMALHFAAASTRTYIQQVIRPGLDRPRLPSDPHDAETYDRLGTAATSLQAALGIA